MKCSGLWVITFLRMQFVLLTGKLHICNRYVLDTNEFTRQNQGRTLFVKNWILQARPPTASLSTQCITAQLGQPIRRRHHMIGTTLTEDLISTGINRYKSFGCRIAQIMIYEPTFWTFCSILENLNGSDIRVLVKYLEERSQMVSNKILGTWRDWKGDF